MLFINNVVYVSSMSENQQKIEFLQAKIAKICSELDVSVFHIIHESSF